MEDADRGGDGTCAGPIGGAGIGMGATKFTASREGARDLGASVLVDLGGASDLAGAGLCYVRMLKQ